MEKVQYRACLAITCGIQGTSRGRWHGKSLFLENNKSLTPRLPLLLSRFSF